MHSPGLAGGLGRDCTLEQQQQQSGFSSQVQFLRGIQECGQHLTLQGRPHPYTGKIQTESEPLEWLWHLAAPRPGTASPTGHSSQPPPHGPSKSGQLELGKAPQNHPRAPELKNGVWNSGVTSQAPALCAERTESTFVYLNPREEIIKMFI